MNILLIWPRSMNLVVLFLVILLNIQVAFAADSRMPIPVSCMELPNNVQIRQVNCDYFSSNNLKLHNLSIVKHGTYENRLEPVNFGYKLYNLRDASKGKLNNDSYITGLSLSIDRIQKCFIITKLCYDSDLHNSFARASKKSLQTKEGLLYLGIPISDDCDDVHGSLNGPSYLVLSFDRKTLAMDNKHCYYEKSGIDDAIPFDNNSTELRYSPGYVHYPPEHWR